MNFDELYPGRFLKAGLIPGGIATFTVQSVYREDIEGNDKASVIMKFFEISYQYVLPKINAVAISEMFGKNVQNWINQQITFYTTNKIMPFPSRPQEKVIRVYGSPAINSPVQFNWRPPSPAGKPKRREISQTLVPTGALTAALTEIRSRPPEQFAALEPWIAQLAADGAISAGEQTALLLLMKGQP
jgi:hypothetical protein